MSRPWKTRKIMGGILIGMDIIALVLIILSGRKMPYAWPILFAVLVLGIVLIVWPSNPRAQYDKKKPNNSVAPKINTNLYAKLIHMAGLPLSEGAVCYVSITPKGMVIARDGNKYFLAFEKVTDMCIKTEADIRKSYVSSIGGAVGGAVLFGPLGAMIGGRVKEKNDTTVKNYFIIAYDKDGATDYISFDCTGSFKVHAILKAYQSYPKEKVSVTL